MQLPHAASVFATTLLAVATARLVTGSSTSNVIFNDAQATGSTKNIESAYLREAESLQVEGHTEGAGNQVAADIEHDANVTRRDVFSDEGFIYLKECEFTHSKGRCYMHEVSREGSCFLPKFGNIAKTYIPDKGVSCHMLDVMCAIQESWIGFLQYPGTADTANDPIWQYAQLVDVHSIYCWVPKFDDPLRKTEPHYWAIPHFWRPMPWWQAPGILQQGVVYDPKWDYAGDGQS